MNATLLIMLALAMGASSVQRYRLIPQIQLPPWAGPLQPPPLRYWQLNHSPAQKFLLANNLLGLWNMNNVLPTVTRTVTAIAFNTITSTLTSYCLQIDPGVTACRRRRGIQQEDYVYIGDQPFRPSEVARMVSTQVPVINQYRESKELQSSMEDQVSPQGRFLLPFNPTTYVTVTVTGLTIVTVNGGVQPVGIGGCVPACLTGLQACI